MTEGPRWRHEGRRVVEDPEESDYWIFHDGRPIVWVTSRRLYTLSPSQSPSSVTLGLTDTASAPCAWTQPEGRGAAALPRSFLRNRPGRAPRQEVWQQPWGKEPGPASVTRFLRDLAPRPGPGRVLRLGRGTWARDPSGGRGVPNMPSLRGLQFPSPASNGSARGAHGRSWRQAVWERFH